MKRKDLIRHTMENGMEEQKEAIRRMVLAAADEAPSFHKRRWPSLAAGAVGVAACLALLAVGLAGHLPLQPPESDAPGVVPSSQDATASSSVSHDFTVSLRYAGGQSPLTDSVNVQIPYVRYFWADEEETEEAVRMVKEEEHVSADSEEKLQMIRVFNYQEGFRQHKNFITLHGSHISITGQNLKNVRFSCGKSLASYYSPSVYNDYMERFPDEDHSNSIERIKEYLNITSYFQLPWRKLGPEITLTAEQLEASYYFLELKPTGEAFQAMLYQDGYTYADWADTVALTATFTDGSVLHKTIHVSYTEEGVQQLTMTD